MLCRLVGRLDGDWERRIFETVVHTLSVLRVSDEPSGIATTHG